MEATLLAVNVRPEEVLCAGEANLVSCVPVACSAMTKEWNCVIGRTGGAFNSTIYSSFDGHHHAESGGEGSFCHKGF